MDYGYSDTIPDTFEQRDDELIHRYGVEEIERPGEDGDDPETVYRFRYVSVKLPDTAPALAKYYNLVAKKVNAERAMEEQVGILRKFLAGVNGQLAFLADELDITLPENEYADEFGCFNAEVEEVKEEAKTDLGLS